MRTAESRLSYFIDWNAAGEAGGVPLSSCERLVGRIRGRVKEQVIKLHTGTFAGIFIAAGFLALGGSPSSVLAQDESGTGASAGAARIEVYREARSIFVRELPAIFQAGRIEGIPVSRSAIDLLGSEKGPAGFKRLEFRRWLELHLAGRFEQALETAVDGQPLSEIFGQNPGNLFGMSFSQRIFGRRIWFEFEDGSRLPVIIERGQFGGDLKGNVQLVSFEVRLQLTRIQVNDLWAIPESSGHYYGFSYSRNLKTLSALLDHALRHGVSVRYGKDESEGCHVRLDCPTAKTIAGQFCDVSASRDHLNDCASEQ